MSGFIFTEWGNENERRKFPVDDTATCVDDSGAILPDGLLSDARISYPQSSGYCGFLFLSGIRVAGNLVTATFSASSSPSATALFFPVCAVTVRKPVTPHYPYSVTPFIDGAAGWVSFGSEAGRAGQAAYRFSTPAQSRMALRTYFALPAETVLGVGSSMGTGVLSGVVEIKSGGPLTVSVLDRKITIDGVTSCKKCIVFELNKSYNPTIFDDFAGPCGKDPAAGNCGRTPIKSINAVPAGCDGNIAVSFEDPIVQRNVDVGCGLMRTVSYAMGVSDEHPGHGSETAQPGALWPSQGSGVLLSCHIGLKDMCPKDVPSTPIYDSCNTPECGASGSESPAVEEFAPVPVDRKGVADEPVADEPAAPSSLTRYNTLFKSMDGWKTDTMDDGLVVSLLDNTTSYKRGVRFVFDGANAFVAAGCGGRGEMWLIGIDAGGKLGSPNCFVIARRVDGKYIVEMSSAVSIEGRTRLHVVIDGSKELGKVMVAAGAGNGAVLSFEATTLSFPDGGMGMARYGEPAATPLAFDIALSGMCSPVSHPADGRRIE